MSKDQKLVKIKRDTKSLVMKNLIVMAVLIIIALTGVISWFTNKTKATADGINVTCKAPKGLKIAVVRHGDSPPTDKDFENNGTITLTKDKYPFLKEQSIIEITSDGTDFYKPKLTQENGKAKPDPSSVWDVADKDSYLSIDVYMKTGEDHVVYLNSETEISPISTTLTGEQSDNKSDDGDFSKDCIVGAVRLSTVSTVSTVNSTDSTIKNLWIPAPQIHYNSDKKEVTLNNTPDTPGDTFKHMYWKVTKNPDGETGTPNGTKPIEYTEYNGVITNTNNDFKLGKKCEFAKLTKKQSSDEYAIGMTTVNIWVDGEDDEARFAMVGGKFKATIKLSL